MHTEFRSEYCSFELTLMTLLLILTCKTSKKYLVSKVLEVYKFLHDTIFLREIRFCFYSIPGGLN